MSNRIYEAGRSTEGYERGDQVASVSEVSEGDILILVTNQFQAENLVVVVPRPEDFVGVNDGGRFYFYYFDADFKCGVGHLMSIWDFEINGITGTEQVVYRAVPVKEKAVPSKIDQK